MVDGSAAMQNAGCATPASSQNYVPVYGSSGWTNYTTEELVREQRAFAEKGFTRTKMKVVS